MTGIDRPCLRCEKEPRLDRHPCHYLCQACCAVFAAQSRRLHAGATGTPTRTERLGSSMRLPDNRDQGGQ